MLTTNTIVWLVLIAMFAWMMYSRFAGKIAPAEAKAMVAAGAALVDVRTTGEFSGGHIPGAVNIPVHELAGRSGEIGPKERPVVVYCASGMRSASAAKSLKAAGFAKVVDLGSMARW